MPFDALPKQSQAAAPIPFRSAEDAWFWTSRCLTARRQGRRQDPEAVIRRPCTPDQVLKCLDQLYRAGRIDMVHARVLRHWGERGHAPNRRQGGDRSDFRQWRQAMGRLEEALRAKGFVAEFTFNADQVDVPGPPQKVNTKFLKAQNLRLTNHSTSTRNHVEANLDGSLIATRTAGVSRPGTIRLLPLAAISPPNPDQLRVTPTGVTLSFLVPEPAIPTLSKKEI